MMMDHIQSCIYFSYDCLQYTYYNIISQADQHTPLVKACLIGDAAYNAAQTLLAYGADPNGNVS